MKLKLFVIVLIFSCYLIALSCAEENVKDLELQEELGARELEQGEQKRAVCPGGGNCNGHGSCSAATGTCTCSNGWAGSDCSYAVTPLTNGVTLRGQHLDSRQWHFYTIATTSGNSLTITINQTSLGGDVDLYLLLGDYPTRTHYTRRDISTDKNFVVYIDGAAVGTWYIGVYGYLSTDFAITGTATGGLCADLNNCNPPNGVCVSLGVCSCNSGWAGPSCSIQLKPVTLGTAYTEAVGLRQWIYYTAQITRNNNLRVTVGQESSSGDVDLYIKAQELPGLTNYDYRDTSFSRNYTILINEPQLGTWYFGFYGYAATTFTFTVTANTQCPSNCSNHGICYGANCNCYSGFQGIYCQTMTNSMSPGVPVAGYVDNNSWNYYTYTALTESNLVIAVAETNAGDCDIYAKQGANPTKFVYDYKDIGVNSNFQLNIPQPTGTWYFGVYGYSACQYTITASISNQCPGNPPCSNHGQCTPEGICDCNDNWSGANCSLALSTMANGNTYSNAVNLNSWIFYQLPAYNTTFIAVGVQETNTIGFLWTFISKGRMPDLRNYDFANQETNTKYHHLDLTLDSQDSDTWIIGVYANPFAANGPIPFTISAWYSPF